MTTINTDRINLKGQLNFMIDLWVEFLKEVGQNGNQ